MYDCVQNDLSSQSDLTAISSSVLRRYFNVVGTSSNRATNKTDIDGLIV